MIARVALFAGLTACATPSSPLSLEVHYQADAQKLPQAETLSAVRVGVARFGDARPRRADDIHAASYVAHTAAYDVGMSWQGRTFVPADRVLQALLVGELRRAGFNAEPIDAALDGGDLLAAQTFAARDHFDVVLAGTIEALAYNHGNPQVALDVALFDGAHGVALWRAPLRQIAHLDSEAPMQQRVDAVLDRCFRPVAHALVGALATQLGTFIAAATEQAQKPEPAVAPPPPEPPPAPEPPHPHHKKPRR